MLLLLLLPPPPPPPPLPPPPPPPPPPPLLSVNPTSDFCALLCDDKEWLISFNGSKRFG
jgi:hypothetical protein